MTEDMNEEPALDLALLGRHPLPSSEATATCLDDETIARLATGDPGSEAENRHLSGCRYCCILLSESRKVVGLAPAGKPRPRGRVLNLPLNRFLADASPADTFRVAAAARAPRPIAGLLAAVGAVAGLVDPSWRKRKVVSRGPYRLEVYSNRAAELVATLTKDGAPEAGIRLSLTILVSGTPARQVRGLTDDSGSATLGRLGELSVPREGLDYVLSVELPRT